jgi:hypothetical protein
MSEWPLAVLGPAMVAVGCVLFAWTARLPVMWLLLLAGR